MKATMILSARLIILAGMTYYTWFVYISPRYVGRWMKSNECCRDYTYSDFKRDLEIMRDYKTEDEEREFEKFKNNFTAYLGDKPISFDTYENKRKNVLLLWLLAFLLVIPGILPFIWKNISKLKAS